ncbi:S9 family peptidase [Sphingomonas sp. SM33]|uniref:S9 family peptidase n=1 Tax=Sphingomonas telluris TaxID=2907998 RepID=A0ABS9VLU7_9SPHN|nr:S9 family peptidase [Sphingomonas telluris]MCH8615935.1 S9 family peptidase [Sphingomonas telluris]
MRLSRSLAPLALLLSATSLNTPASAAPATAPSRHLTGSDLFNLEVATDPQISPDGKTIAYVRKSNDIMTDNARSTIWLIDVASGQQRPLLAGSGSYFSPRWSRDGSRLAYVAAEGGAPQLFVRWMANGESARITGLPDSPDSIAWSPDGQRIAYSMFVPDDGPKLGQAPAKPEGAKWADPLQVIDAITYRFDGAGYFKPGYQQIFWVPADGGAPTQLTFGPTNAGAQVSWTPDSRSVIFSANLNKDWDRNLNESEVYRVSIDGGTPVALTTRKGPDASPIVSPDGKLIAYVGYDESGKAYDDTKLYVMNLNGSGARALTGGFDRAVNNPVWSADGRSVYVLYDEHGSNRVARVGLDGSVRDVASGLTGSGLDRPYSGGEFTVSRDGRIAVTAGDPSRPSDIAIASGGSLRRLTRLNDSSLGAKVLGEVTKLPVTSSFDQRPIDAWMVMPPDYDPSKKYPLILEIHGGPWSAYGPTFSTDDQLYASAGYVVLYANPRGSTSYGQAFADEIDKNYPSHDYDDLMSAVDAAIATGRVDPNNLFVTGGSGGGVLTAWIVGKTDRFRGAATQKPVIELASFALTTDFAAAFSPGWRKERPWEDPQAYWKYSPLSLVGNVKTPTLVVVGSEDFRTPVSQAEQYYTALQLRGIPTALVKVPGASHGGIAARPSQSAAKASAILAWFERYRQKPAATTADLSNGASPATAR